MAQNYNALILLIAHKKKGDGADENDDVLCSSEITNLAGVIMSYGRSKYVEDGQRVIKITKNRLTGRCEFDGIVCGYDDASKRIFAADDMQGAIRMSKCFADRDEPENGFVQVTDEIEEEVPF
jgi:hypothetical protein